MFIFYFWRALLLFEMKYSSPPFFVRLIFLSNVSSLLARKLSQCDTEVTMLIFKSQSENTFHLRSVENHKCISFEKFDFTHCFTTLVKILSALGVCLLWIFVVFFMGLNVVLDLFLLNNLVIPGGILQSINITIYNKMDFPILLITVLIFIYKLVIPSINPFPVIGWGHCFLRKPQEHLFYSNLQLCYT